MGLKQRDGVRQRDGAQQEQGEGVEVEWAQAEGLRVVLAHWEAVPSLEVWVSVVAGCSEAEVQVEVVVVVLVRVELV